jgi:hypothetical protein
VVNRTLRAAGLVSAISLSFAAQAGQNEKFRGISSADALKMGLDGFMKSAEAKGKKFTLSDQSKAFVFFAEARRLISFNLVDKNGNQLDDKNPRYKAFMVRNEIATSMFTILASMVSTTGQATKRSEAQIEAEGNMIAAYCGEIQFAMLDKKLPATSTVTVPQMNILFENWKKATIPLGKGQMKELVEYSVKDLSTQYSAFVKSLSKVDAGSADLFRRLFAHVRAPQANPRPF